MQMREKVGKSRNTVFFQWFVAPEGRKIGSLERRVRSQLARWEMKNCTPLWRKAHLQVKMYKTHHSRTTFGSWDVEKVHAVLARSTFRSQNVQNTRGSDHFWTLRCRSAWQVLGIVDLVKSEQNVRVCSIFNYNHHYTTLHSNTPHYTPIRYTTTTTATTTTPSLHSTTLAPLHSTTLHYTQLHPITFNYIQLHYATLHYTTLHYTTLHYTTLHCLPLHYITLHYTTLHYTTLHYTTVHCTTLHYLPLHYITLHYTPLHYNYTTTLHYTPLH